MSFRSRLRSGQPVETRQRSVSAGRYRENGPTKLNSTPSSSIFNSYRPTSSTAALFSTPINNSTYNYQNKPLNYNKSSYGSKENLSTSTKYLNNRRDNNGHFSSLYSIPNTTTDHFQTSYSQNLDDGGVTKASLNFSYVPPSTATHNDYRVPPKPMFLSNLHSMSSVDTLNSRRDFTPRSAKSTLDSSHDYLGSNPQLNNYSSFYASPSLGRSQSLRDQERKSRSRNRKTQSSFNNTITNRSTCDLNKSTTSICSNKSLGYEVRFVVWMLCML